MQAKKMAAAIVVGYILVSALGYLIHEVWLMPVYRLYAEVWRSHEVMTHKMWVNMVGQLLFVILFVWIYTRGVENKPWAGQGIRYGIVMSLLAVIPVACTEYTVYPIPYTLAVKWMVAGTVQVIVLALVTAFFIRKPAA